MKGRHHAVIQLLWYGLLISGGIIAVFPFVWMVSTSLKPSDRIFIYPPEFFSWPLVWKNYVIAWTEVPFASFIINSVVYSVARTFGVLLTSSLAAYAFARIRFLGRDVLFLGYLGTLMVPYHVLLIPLFLIMRDLQWVDTYVGLIVPGLTSAYGTFLLRQFFLTIPKDLEDAAFIDGCGRIRIYSTIILPLSKPAIVTLGLFNFMANWNDFLWPLIVTNAPEMRTLPVGLTLFSGMFQHEIQWHLLMAGTTLATIPVLGLFLFTQRFFVRGITLSGLKA